MTNNDQKALITEIVNENPGIKANALVTDVINEAYRRGMFHPEHKDFDKGEDPVEVINDMVKNGDLMEVEYIVPSMDYRIKSLYFPKGTKVEIVSYPQSTEANEITKILTEQLSVDVAVGDDLAAVQVSGIDAAVQKIIAHAITKQLAKKVFNENTHIGNSEDEEDPLVLELVNQAVTENLKEDGTPKYQSSQGYACALSAIKLYRKRISG